jgi:predicted nucleic acid-binding protein
VGLKIPTQRVTYLDANIFIYFLEQNSDFFSALEPLFAAIDEGKMKAVTSEMSITEVLVKPIRESNFQLQDEFEAILQTSGTLIVAPVDRAVLVRAAELRAKNASLKTPDAIHVATALEFGCDAFITNDSRITKSLIDVWKISDLIEGVHHE